MAWNPAHLEWDVLRVRGNKSLDEAHFFDEVAAALQFPYYFGENWDAVWDCITDLNWLRGSSFLIVFDSAEHLLSQSDRGFTLLLRCLPTRMTYGIAKQPTSVLVAANRSPFNPSWRATPTPLTHS